MRTLSRIFVCNLNFRVVSEPKGGCNVLPALLTPNLLVVAQRTETFPPTPDATRRVGRDPDSVLSSSERNWRGSLFRGREDPRPRGLLRVR